MSIHPYCYKLFQGTTTILARIKEYGQLFQSPCHWKYLARPAKAATQECGSPWVTTCTPAIRLGPSMLYAITNVQITFNAWLHVRMLPSFICLTQNCLLHRHIWVRGEIYTKLCRKSERAHRRHACLEVTGPQVYCQPWQSVQSNICCSLP